MNCWLNKSEGHGTKENSQVAGMRRLKVISSYVIKQRWIKQANALIEDGEEEIIHNP